MGGVTAPSQSLRFRSSNRVRRRRSGRPVRRGHALRLRLVGPVAAGLVCGLLVGAAAGTALDRPRSARPLSARLDSGLRPRPTAVVEGGFDRVNGYWRTLRAPSGAQMKVWFRDDPRDVPTRAMPGLGGTIDSTGTMSLDFALRLDAGLMIVEPLPGESATASCARVIPGRSPGSGGVDSVSESAGVAAAEYHELLDGIQYVGHAWCRGAEGFFVEVGVIAGGRYTVDQARVVLAEAVSRASPPF